MKLGAQEKSAGNLQFYVIKHHCVCQESKTERPGYEAREVLNPQNNETLVRYIKPYDSLIGYITDIEWRDTGEKYDQRYVDWRIHLNLGDTNGVLTIPFHSRHSTRFMMLAENIDYSRPVEFRAWKDNEGGTAFYVGQFANDEDEKSLKVDQKYRKDDMGDCPQGEQRLGGKWNFDAQNDFLYKRMMTVVIPAVKAAQSNGYVAPEPNGDAQPSMTREELIDRISGICRDLNTNGDSIKWARATLNNFINETYQTTDGLDSLSPDYLAKLINLLSHRLQELEVPF